MEEKQSDVLVIDTLASAYCKRVELALKVKGIPYKSLEEDLSNKSELLLSYNPVHKKVPVLVHNGNPISESLVILEYIDEYWNNSPKLLPEDPYQRAKVRFWATFFDQKVIPHILPIFMSKGLEQEKAIEDFIALLKMFEDGIKKDFPGKFPFFSSGQSLDFLDIIVGSNLCGYRAINEAVAVILSQEKNPEIFSWVNALREHPLIKEIMSPHEKLVARIREKFSLSLKS
ncbi:S-crystallin [Trema orientale]|uniref:Glutathione S-transferase n=1 Tax=Trema orientale TaxID=63057 RepID=A0A2P5D190_TREOI|nr:S-crystallin [Trema orientale]